MEYPIEGKIVAKVQIKNGILHKMIVFDNGIQVGTGYVIYYPSGRMSDPILISPTGEKLPEGWYHLIMTDEQWNVVVPMRKQ
jgi:hypothetical protein